MQDIVRESGLSPGAIYGYFAGKSDIVAAIASRRHATERERIQSALAADGAPGSLDRLIETFAAVLDDPRDDVWRRLAVQMWAESLSDKKIRRETLHGVSQALSLLTPVIDAAKTEGRWPAHIESTAIARVMIAVLQGLSLQLAWEKVDGKELADAAKAVLSGSACAQRPKRRSQRPTKITE